MGACPLAQRVLHHEDLEQHFAVVHLALHEDALLRDEEVVEGNHRQLALRTAPVLLAGAASHDAVLTPAPVRQVVYSVVVTFFLSRSAGVWRESSRPTLVLCLAQLHELASGLHVLVVRVGRQVDSSDFGVLDHHLETTSP